MSCNGCRVLRKGCSENCILRPCLQWIEGLEAQGYATLFAAKFFGRAGLMSFISAVPDTQKPALFQSLLFEAAGRTVNPVNGAVGLLSTGNWHVCQAAVETVLRGGTLRAIPEMINQSTSPGETSGDMLMIQNLIPYSKSKQQKLANPTKIAVLGLGFPAARSLLTKKNRSGTPSINSEESATITCLDAAFGEHAFQGEGPKLLNLFN